MSYSCADFTDTIITALGVDVPLESADSPSDQADLCIAEIDGLKREAEAASAMLAALRNPAGLDEHSLVAMDVHTLRATMREYRDEARAAIAQAEAAGIKVHS